MTSITNTKVSTGSGWRNLQFASLSPVLANLVLAGLIGCGDGRPQTYRVAGELQYADGAPVRSGYVELIPVAGGPSARGAINQRGDFVVGTYTADDGAAAGDFAVLVLQHGPQISPEAARELGPDHAEHEHETSRVSLKYSSRATSDLSCTVRESDLNRLHLTVEVQEPQRGRPPKAER